MQPVPEQGANPSKESKAVFPSGWRGLVRSARWRAGTVLRRALAGFAPPGPSLHVVGDSHAKFCFRNASGMRIHYLGPVTMHRIARDGRESLRLRDLGVYDHDVVVWCLGEIDVRCHVIRQAQRQGVPVESIVNPLAERFLQSVADITRDARAIRTVILSVVPPTDQVANEDFPLFGTLKERIEARGLLNAALKENCRRQDFQFLDPYPAFANSFGALNESMSDGNVHIGPSFTPIVIRQVRELCAPWLGKARANP